MIDRAVSDFNPMLELHSVNQLMDESNEQVPGREISAQENQLIIRAAGTHRIWLFFERGDYLDFVDNLGGDSNLFWYLHRPLFKERVRGP